MQSSDLGTMTLVLSIRLKHQSHGELQYILRHHIVFYLLSFPTLLYVYPYLYYSTLMIFRNYSFSWLFVLVLFLIKCSHWQARPLETLQGVFRPRREGWIYAKKQLFYKCAHDFLMLSAAGPGTAAVASCSSIFPMALSGTEKESGRWVLSLSMKC